MLKIEDVKVGDELVCIDRDGFNNSHRHNNTLTEFKVCKVGDLGVCINDGDWIIEIEELKYFKKKEQSQQYTFIDLVNAIAKAQADGVLLVDRVHFTVKESRSFLDDIQLKNSADFEDHIKYIKSLYKETFVIESEEDVKKVSDDCDRITLANGELMPKKVFRKLVHDFTFHIAFKVLKGATVEQERGRDD